MAQEQSGSLAQRSLGIMPVAIGDDVQFDLWMEPEWIPFKHQNLIYESEIVHAFLQLVRPGDMCIDAGANVGYHTVLLSRLVGEKGAVIAFEPDPTHFAKLQANVTLNGIGNIFAMPHALWKTGGNFEFWSVKGGGYSSLARMINMAPTQIVVPAVCLDDAIDEDKHVRLIKIDCEGAEGQILEGAEKLLARTDCVIVEFNYGIMPAFGSSDRSIRDYMNRQGYDFFYLHRDGSTPTCIPNELSIKIEGKSPHVFNGLFVRRGSQCA